MSGVMFGWVGLDVKAQMDMCFPDDAELADEVAEGMHALWWGIAQKVASKTASDPARAAVENTRQCVE